MQIYRQGERPKEAKIMKISKVELQQGVQGRKRNRERERERERERDRTWPSPPPPPAVYPECPSVSRNHTLDSEPGVACERL